MLDLKIVIFFLLYIFNSWISRFSITFFYFFLLFWFFFYLFIIFCWHWIFPFNFTFYFYFCLPSLLLVRRTFLTLHFCCFPKPWRCCVCWWSEIQKETEYKIGKLYEFEMPRFIVTFRKGTCSNVSGGKSIDAFK